MTDSLGPAVLVTAFTLVGVSTVIVALRYIHELAKTKVYNSQLTTCRFFCRFMKSTTLQLSDHLILSALLTTWGIAVINFYQVKYGTGRHMNDQPSKYVSPPILGAVCGPSIASPANEHSIQSWPSHT